VFATDWRLEGPVTTQALDDPALARFRKAVGDAFGGRIERVVLFGSRARGEATGDSDYDIAVFLRDFTDRWQDVDRLVEIETDLLYESGAFVHAMPFRAGAWQERTPLMGAIRRDGVDL
jgi:predicted nucleotidyltransferase